MSIPLGFAKWRAFDADGAPLAAGTLTTYEPGTSTPKATYTTSSGLIANANPVVLDANGEADIWLSGNYKLVLKDGDGATQWTVDNYPGLDGTTQAETTLTPTAGTAISTASALVPQGARLKAVTARVTTGFGTSQGLAKLHIGVSFDGNLLVDAYGRDIALALNTVTTGANFTSADMPIAKTAAGDIVVTAVDGLFDGTGAITLRVSYESYASPS